MQLKNYSMNTVFPLKWGFLSKITVLYFGIFENNKVCKQIMYAPVFGTVTFPSLICSYSLTQLLRRCHILQTGRR